MHTHQEDPQSTVLFPLWFKTDVKFNLEPGPKTGHLVSFPTICIHFHMADQVELTGYCGAHIYEVDINWRGRKTGLCSEDLGRPCAELWSGPMSRRLGELAKVGKVYDIRQIFLLGGLVLIVWCILL